MTEQELREIVRRTVLEVMASQPNIAAGLSPTARRALVLFNGAWLGFDESVRQLERVRDAGVELDIIQTDSAKRFLEQHKIAPLGQEVTQNLVSDHPMLIIPTLTVNCAAKVAHGMADSLATNVIHEFILLNRPIVAVRTAACPDNAEKRAWFPDIPPAFAKVLRRNLQALADFGVQLTDVDGLHDAVIAAWARLDGAPVPGRAEPRTALPDLVSHALLAGVPDGGVLKVARKALVTALAKDEAAARGIRIERQEH
ncbi:flavoprotein [Aestuariimicrobium sp. p3-SID1156]|uniref:flavoprotein n=1 Tax=Aestuariimicrobium sp. p3-SID1156 TaxID=2916038 RepID=UPI00223BFFE6|nr:flavoprotein [Aestuariimicrobium sp. p3-SID1156]MCT1458348.1 flavoprotein [Aestuariimicrobium sp. p3-SID1156]